MSAQRYSAQTGADASAARNPGANHGLYPQILGSTWTNLDERVRSMHCQPEAVRASGMLLVTHGKGVLAHCLIWLLQLPAAGVSVPTRLLITHDGNRERWWRAFNERPFVTWQWRSASNLLVERFGLCEVSFRLEEDRGALIYRQLSAALRFGPVRIPLPRWLSPTVAAREQAAAETDGTHISVAVHAPVVGLLVSYVGAMFRDQE